MFRLSLLISALLAFGGCANTLRPDRAPPAIDAGYPTAEIIACDKRWHGVGICAVKSGTPYSLLNISVQGYYSGSVRVVSTDCKVDQTTSYVNSNSVNVNVPGVASKNCLFTFTVSPSFPESMSNGIPVYSFRGHLAVRVTDSSPWIGDARKASRQFKADLKVPAQGRASARVFFKGCQVTYDRMLLPAEGFVTFPINEAVSSNLPLGICVLDGFMMNAENDVSLNVLMALYSPDFPPLPIPSVSIDAQNKLRVVADSQVSLVSFDSAYIVDSKAAFSFDKNENHVLRILTVKGRSVIGTYSSSSQEWSWQQ